MITLRGNFILNKNQRKLYYRIADELGGMIELMNAHERRWASELQDKNLVSVVCENNNQTFAYVPLYNFVKKIWDGTFGEGMCKNYTTQIVRAPDLITALGSYDQNVLGIEFSDICDPLPCQPTAGRGIKTKSYEQVFL